MKKQLKSFSLKRFYIVSALLLLVPLIIAMPLNIAVFKQNFADHFFIYLISISLGYLISIPLHEGLHALTAILLCRVSPKDITFGMIKEQLMFYCHVDKPMEVYKYRLVLIMPMLLLGLIPLMVVTIIASPYLVILFAMNLSGGAGDLVMFIETFKYDKHQLIEDHPTAPAYYLLYDEKNLPVDFVEATEEQEAELQRQLHKRK